MTCEDCENYKPKVNKKVPKDLLVISGAIYDFCRLRSCNDCPINVVPDDCPVWEAMEVIDGLDK